MNIDYEKISLAAREEASNLLVSVRQVKKIIEAYEAQKAPPEWVPLDLATVKQGQEVWHKDWPNKPTKHTRSFVATYEGGLVLEHQGYLSKYWYGQPMDWLMRAPKPKTVRVYVYRRGAEYAATTNSFELSGVVGEGDIKVTE